MIFLLKLIELLMANSLETRAPFLDHKLIEYVWKIPHSLKYKKWRRKMDFEKNFRYLHSRKFNKQTKNGIWSTN